MAKKTSSGLVNYAIKQIGRPYWYGTFGQNATESLYSQKKKQYPSLYTANDFSNQFGKKVHDCIGLIKGYIWCDNANDKTPKYQSNGCPDVNEEMMYVAATKKGEISSMPDVAGVCVFMPGHVGVYIGNDEVVEARGHSYGVIKTDLKDRGWTRWCYCPYIEYDTEKKEKKEKKNYVKVKTNGSVLNCRKKASVLSKVVGAFKNSTKLTVLKANKKWYKVKGKATSGETITGYCHKKWLKEVK